MSRHVALLRGINVGGNNLIKMPALKACFEAQGSGGGQGSEIPSSRGDPGGSCQLAVRIVTIPSEHYLVGLPLSWRQTGVYQGRILTIHGGCLTIRVGVVLV